MARTQRTTAQWQKFIEEQKQSGLNIKAFCQQHALPTSAFYGWRKRLKAANNTPKLNVTTDWVPVDLTPAAPTSTSDANTWDIELHLPNGVILKMSQQAC